MAIQDRKRDHINLTINGDAEYNHTTGFEQFRLKHCALPELNLSDIDTSVEVFGRTFSIPLFISSMTGGSSEMGQVNRIIAEVCEEYKLPMGVGSQRIMLEDASSIPSFSVVREVAPSAFIAANIGGVQIRNVISDSKLRLLCDSIQADAIIVHLNVLQELMQPEGDRQFAGVLNGIHYLVNHADCPMIVKETGAGIGGPDARKLYDAGVRYIDVAGSGGTSWAKVENLRHQDDKAHSIFNEWGTPTVQCINEIRELGLKDLVVISSGGIRSSLDILKSIAMGANICATAQPIIKVIHENGKKGLIKLIEQWTHEIRMGLLLTGVQSIDALNSNHLYKL
ncbi:MAG TPA: type 2 isopentenyl-diphosphate Delta-isomerase [Bacteroidetes bacterium]|nr:type 2 isopentenyl-diphosphate Delta-isomerase [Bacteroidota bacterium]